MGGTVLAKEQPKPTDSYSQKPTQSEEPTEEQHPETGTLDDGYNYIHVKHILMRCNSVCVDVVHHSKTIIKQIISNGDVSVIPFPNTNEIKAINHEEIYPLVLITTQIYVKIYRLVYRLILYHASSRLSSSTKPSAKYVHVTPDG